MNKTILDFKNQLTNICNSTIMEFNNISSQMVRVYLDAQRAANFKVGDKVRVINTAFSYQAGWQNEWINGMDDYVGKVGIVMLDEYTDETHGIAVYFEENGLIFRFPYFVLEKIENAKEVNKKDKEEFHIYQEVLVRDCDDEEWVPNLFLRKKNDSSGQTYYDVIDTYYAQCIPYKGNEEFAWTTRKPCK